MAANLVEKLNEAIEACEEVSAKDLKSQKEKIAEMFGKLQTAVYGIVDEKGIILANCTWKRKNAHISGSFYSLIDAEAERISIYTGYSKETIREILFAKNAYEYTKTARVVGWEYEFFTIEI